MLQDDYKGRSEEGSQRSEKEIREVRNKKKCVTGRLQRERMLEDEKKDKNNPGFIDEKRKRFCEIELR